ncbi:DinB family protein [Streptomyces sp. NPDC020412]|uniref:DinB family protein n=1 Tax=Streptomyces sp. NPDC020412 TaxID=3365073 RepID=UPI00379CF076
MNATPRTQSTPVHSSPSPSSSRGSLAAFPPPRCNRCDFGARPFDRGAAGKLLREYAARWQRVLVDPGTTERRVGALAWSPLEHGCHVRDMCLLFHRRLDATLGAPDGSGAPASAAVTVPDGAQGLDVPGLYRDEDPRQVGEELGRAADALARRFDRLTDEDWERLDPRFPDDCLTVDFFTRHFFHDVAHDLGEVLRASV